MDYSFSVLNERLRPRVTNNYLLYSSLCRMEDRQMYTSKSPCRTATHSTPPTQRTCLATTEEEGSKGPGNYSDDDSTPGSQEMAKCEDVEPVSIIISEMKLKDEVEEEPCDEDSSSTLSEEKENPCELTTEGTRDSLESVSSTGDGGSPRSRKYIDGTLPDLLNSGSGRLCRRRTLGHVSATLNEVRREVELSRKRSIKLKAQVDKLQESRSGQGWSRHRERVTEEVLSILGLLAPLTDESSPPNSLQGDDSLDIALSQLQNVARQLAISHTKQDSKSGKGEEDAAVLQQALRDRDDAIEKKKMMETELLRSKTEMMALNNQLLEAVQRRLELSLELEAWKEDVQLMLHQNVQSQQQAEQSQKKNFRSLGILRRHNRPTIQRPTNITTSASNPAPVSPTTNPSQIFVPRAAASPPSNPTTPPACSQRTWRDKLRRGRNIRTAEDAVRCSEQDMEGFQVVSLD